MRLETPLTATLADPHPAAAGAPAPGPVREEARFAGLLAQVQTAAAGPNVSVRRGDTLIGLVKAHHRQAGLPIGEGQALRLAHQIAQRNGIANPDRIGVGQRVDFSSLGLPALARAPAPEAWAGLPTSSAWAASRQATQATASPEMQVQRSSDSPTPVLDRTLQRAVHKGFVPPQDADAVRQRIGRLAQEHGFAPDDFALLTLMESDGLNPQASNGRCHGIIQFCDGDGRGAASVGFAQNPRAILGLGVLQQLELVDQYFKETGLKQFGPNASVDDLYLTVLTPAARSEKRRDVPLNIAGQQAAYLYVDHRRSTGITRDSLVAGLHHNAGLRLGMDTRSAMAQPMTRAAQLLVANLARLDGPR